MCVMSSKEAYKRVMYYFAGYVCRWYSLVGSVYGGIVC